MPVMLSVIVWVAIMAVGSLIVVTEIPYRRMRKLVKRAERLLRDAQDLRRRLVEARDELAAELGEDCR